jgi:hypothetical protein
LQNEEEMLMTESAVIVTPFPGDWKNCEIQAWFHCMARIMLTPWSLQPIPLYYTFKIITIILTFLYPISNHMFITTTMPPTKQTLK